MSGQRLRGQGATALWRKGSGFAANSARPKGSDRPWSPAFAGENEGEASLTPRPAAVPRAVDATPSESDLQAED
jgi:competence protein ComEC